MVKKLDIKKIIVIAKIIIFQCFTILSFDDPRDTYFVRMGAIKYDQDFKK